MEYSVTDYAAWWGAVLATLVLLREVYKEWSAKPALLLRTRQIVAPEDKLEIEIANVGNKDITLTRVYVNAGMGVETEPGGRRVVVPSGGHRNSASSEERFALPYKLTPGSVWNGWVDPRRIFHIDDLNTIVVKVRDERDVMVKRLEETIPDLWRRSKGNSE